MDDDEVRVPKMAEIIAGRVRRRIVTGELRPGESLPTEVELIEQFQVSRPTIREAIRLLEFEGLISISRGARGGAKVREHSTAFTTRAMGVALQTAGISIADVYKARAMIEPLAAGLAAEHRSKEAGKVLLDHVEREEEELARSGIVTELTAEFHRLVLAECGNATLALIGDSLAGLVERHSLLAFRSNPTTTPESQRNRSRRGVKSHRVLAQLISEGRAEEAEAHWKKHMAATEDHYIGRLGESTVLDILDD